MLDAWWEDMLQAEAELSGLSEQQKKLLRAAMARPKFSIEFTGELTDRHVSWLNEALKPGDLVTIRILGEGEFDEPAEGSPERKPGPAGSSTDLAD
jgi:hypothetical protein